MTFEIILVYFCMPFLLALLMPNRKWLAAHAVLFTLIVAYLYIDNERTPVNARGAAEWLGILLRYLLGFGAASGVVACGIALYLKMKGWRRIPAVFTAAFMSLGILAALYAIAVLWR